MALQNPLTPYRGQVIAMLPVYDNTAGNITELYLRNGKMVKLNRTLPLVLRDYLGLWALDRLALQRLYATDKRNALIAPLAILSGHTLMPLRARQPIGKHDGAYAFLEYESIVPNSFREHKGGLNLQCGSFDIKLLCSKRQLQAMLGRAACTAERYRQLNEHSFGENSSRLFLQQWTVLQGIVNQSMARMITESQDSIASISAQASSENSY